MILTARIDGAHAPPPALAVAGSPAQAHEGEVYLALERTREV